ncbi:MAG: hypothetical protein HXS41_05230 [Theionarchaea archaeon]|nr:hypothetical protein [Theionarchaea archaeon]MBU7020438.1 hypothetical protein [Theionarchaea archaeon]MBU7034783.1 hypothetical protein [Theionarchaea archaeon]MBU7040879.1 hypothetical protein [Theionarchaea archaeon]
MNEEKDTESEPLLNTIIIGLLVLLTFAMLVIATGLLVPLPEEIVIPPYILLYAFLGSLAYLLTSSIAECEKLLKSKEYQEVNTELEELKHKLESTDVTDSSLTDDIAEHQRRRSELVAIWKKVELRLWVKLARIPFGMVLAVGFYLLIPLVVSSSLVDTSSLRLMAGVAFVVALFPKVAMNGLTGLASRLISSNSAGK